MVGFLHVQSWLRDFLRFWELNSGRISVFRVQISKIFSLLRAYTEII